MDLRYLQSNVLLQAESLWHQTRLFSALSSWVLKPPRWRLHKLSGQPNPVPDCPLWFFFFPYMQVECLISVYDSCLSFSCCAQLWRAWLQLLNNPPGRQVRLLWDSPEAVLHPGWISPAPPAFVCRASAWALTILVASAGLPQACQCLHISGPDFCRNNCRNKFLNLCLSRARFDTIHFSCYSLS